MTTSTDRVRRRRARLKRQRLCEDCGRRRPAARRRRCPACLRRKAARQRAAYGPHEALRKWIAYGPHEAERKRRDRARRKEAA